MALFEDEPWDDAENSGLEPENVYLKAPEKGLELVRTILKRDRRQPKASEEPWTDIPALLADLSLEGESEFYHRITQLRRRMKEEGQVSLLEGKVVLGIGGRFSAGKSYFINSIAGAKLPVDQRETTSIATYVIHSNTRQNVALTTGGKNIELDDEAVQALTHQFYGTYGIGFSRVIRNLTICTPIPQYPNIAILDTPGYSKADTGKAKEVKDEVIAKQRLESVDYLIWLVDVENGGLQGEDRKFIRSLPVSTPILIVFNKAGLVSLEKAQTVVKKTKEQLDDLQKEVYAVIAYDSMLGRTIVGEGVLEKFLEQVNGDSQRSQSLQEQCHRLRDDICSSIDAQIKVTEKLCGSVEDAIACAKSTKGLGAIITEYTARKRQKAKLLQAKNQLQTKMTMRKEAE